MTRKHKLEYILVETVIYYGSSGTVTLHILLELTFINIISTSQMRVSNTPNRIAKSCEAETSFTY